MITDSKFQDFMKQASREELLFELEKYIALLQENENLITTLDVDEVLERVLEKACGFTGAANASIFLINEKESVLEFAASTDESVQRQKITVPLGSGISGQVAQSGKLVNIHDAQNDPNFYQKVDEKTGNVTHSYLCVPLIADKRIIGTAQLLNKTTGTHFDNNDERFMILFASQAALAIETAILHQRSLEAQAMEQEVRHASSIQKQILPNKDIDLPGYVFRGSSDPARMVGGDYFKYFKPFGEDTPNGPVYGVLADVSGKGIPAAMIVSNLDAALQLILPYHNDLSRLTIELNNYLCNNLSIGTFITLFMFKLIPRQKEIEYVSCGHNATYCIPGPRDEAGAEPAKGTRIKKMQNSGPILGLKPGFPYQSYKSEFLPGDLYIIYSDGIVEAQNADDELYGDERFLKTVTRSLRDNRSTKNAPYSREDEKEILGKVHADVIADVAAFRAGHRVNDDTTLLLAYRCHDS